jgi:hypothetical protein
MCNSCFSLDQITTHKAMRYLLTTIEQFCSSIFSAMHQTSGQRLAGVVVESDMQNMER